MRVVFDTNILFSAIGWRGKPHECVQHARRGRCRSITCAEILAELEEKLIEKRNFSPAKAADAAGEVRLFSEVVRIEGSLRIIAADPDDDMFLECAQVGSARFIVSGDHHLLEVGNHEGIRIVPAADFLKILDGSEG